MTDTNPVIDCVTRGHVHNLTKRTCNLDGEDWPCKEITTARALAIHRSAALKLADDIRARDAQTIQRKT